MSLFVRRGLGNLKPCPSTYNSNNSDTSQPQPAQHRAQGSTKTSLSFVLEKKKVERVSATLLTSLNPLDPSLFPPDLHSLLARAQRPGAFLLLLYDSSARNSLPSLTFSFSLTNIQASATTWVLQSLRCLSLLYHLPAPASTPTSTSCQTRPNRRHILTQIRHSPQLEVVAYLFNALPSSLRPSAESRTQS